MEIIVIVLSFLIGLAYLFLLRSFDRYEKDSFFKLLVSFVIGGLASVVISTVLYTNIEVSHTFGDAFIKIGLIEELSKMCAFIIILLLFRKSVNEIVDGLIYMSTIALGFACIENVLYALSSPAPLLLLFQRAVFSVAGHLSFAGYMGIALFIHFKRRRNYTGIVLSLLLAALAHGLYDGVLFEHSLNELFHYIFILLVVAHIFLYKIVLSFSKFRPIFSFELFKDKGTKESAYCIRCERERETLNLAYGKIFASRCSSCNSFIFDNEGWLDFIRFFRPIINSRKYGKFLMSEFQSHKPVELDSGGGIIFDPGRKLFNAKEEALRSWVDYHNHIDQQRVLKIPVIGLLLKYLGLRFLVSEAKS